MTDSSSSDTPPPRRRWLRRLVFVFALLAVLLGASVLYATSRLSSLAKWALERAFPSATVEIGGLDFDFPDRLNIESLVLRSRNDGKVLLSLTGGSMTFNFDDLWQRQIGEIRLIEPVLHVSPRLTEAFAPAPGDSRKKSGVPWSVHHLVCDYGELIVTGYGNAGLVVRAKFAFDFQNFSPAGAPAALHSFVLWDIDAATGSDPPFLSVDLLDGGFTFEGLLKKKNLSTLTLKGGSLLVGASLRKLFPASTDSGSTAPAAPPQQPWTIGTLDIADIAVTIDDERPRVTDITFTLNTTLKNLPLTQAASSLGAEDQIVEIAHLDILSPYDPLTKVMTIERIFVHFTLAGLLKREIADLTIRGPTIHVGQDLFWYMEDIKKRFGTSDADAGPDTNDTTPGWTIRRLFIHEGALVIGSGGRKEYGLPLDFYASAHNVALDHLASLEAELTLEIPPRKYVFESYQLEFTTEPGGSLKFSYPPEKQQNNLVGDVKIKDIHWRQYRASDAYVSVTFDEQGINGAFGGHAYRGNLGGGFSFFFDPATPWIGWLYGLNLDLRQLTNIISPQNFQMSGPLNFTLQMDARGKTIERVVGDFQIPESGKMVIKKLDDLLALIPPTWTPLKESSTRIALETLRDFQYDHGSGDFWFVRSQGILQLQLQGPHGSRKLKVVLHANDSPVGHWKTRSGDAKSE